MKQPCSHCNYQDSWIELRSEWVEIKNEKHIEWFYTCLNCGARGPNAMSKENAYAMWNMRRGNADPFTAGAVWAAGLIITLPALPFAGDVLFTKIEKEAERRYGETPK